MASWALGRLYLSLGPSVAAGLFGLWARIAELAQRGEVFAVALVVSYLAFSIPAVVAGFATTNVGLHETSIVYSAAVMAFCAIALVAQGDTHGKG